MTDDIADLLDGKTHYGAFPAPAAEILIARYVAGYLLAVSRRRTNRKPDVEQLEGCDEVWAICPRKPAPGWRILGRFYRFNVFIALRAWDKHDLARRYTEAAEQIIRDWQTLFGNEPAHSGRTIYDYMCPLLRDFDEEI